eukprot:209309-Rhodomonas_salina.1
MTSPACNGAFSISSGCPMWSRPGCSGGSRREQLVGNDVINLKLLFSTNKAGWQKMGCWALVTRQCNIFAQPLDVLDGLDATKPGWHFNEHCVGSLNL